MVWCRKAHYECENEETALLEMKEKNAAVTVLMDKYNDCRLQHVQVFKRVVTPPTRAQ